MYKLLSVSILLTVCCFADDFKQDMQDCNKNKNNIACHSVGAEYYEQKDFKNAMKYFMKACELKYVDSCLVVGNTYALGQKAQNIAKNVDKAIKYYEIGCDLNHVGCCSGLGLIYGDLENEKLERKYHKKACELNDGGSCYILSLSYFDNPAMKAKYFKKACELGYIEAKHCNK